MDINDYVVLWSPQQRAFHVETIGQMLRTNREVFAQQGTVDYIVLGFERTYESAIASGKNLRDLIDKVKGVDDENNT